MRYLLGFDIGSSSIKAALVDAGTGRVAGAVHAPDSEMDMTAVEPGWAEQSPEVWWTNCAVAVKKLLHQTGIRPDAIAAIGISYQMHGLVAIDRDGQPVRPSIIWCDSRAVTIGDKAFHDLGPDYCLEHYLNSPGNFTASKLKWIKDNEPDRYERIRYCFLPGDYIAYKLTGEALTTVSGLSEGILWDFQQNGPADRLLEYYGVDPELLPPLAPTFGHQGTLTAHAAAELGLNPGIPITYRAGDQPNNALSLNVLNPGEVAATGGTSGVVYGVIDRLAYDPDNRVNSFAHVNHQAEHPRIGVLLCINGAGIQYSWTRRQVARDGVSYDDMERMAAAIPIGSDGLRMLPFGNGAERMLGNRNIGAQILDLEFNRHNRAHFYRAALEGIAFSFVYGMKILQELGLNLSVMRVGNDNLFQSEVFSQTISGLLGCRIEMMQTTGAVGAAIASGVGIGIWSTPGEALNTLEQVKLYEPAGRHGLYHSNYEHWAQCLESKLSST
jgi:xylulokinase